MSFGFILLARLTYLYTNFRSSLDYNKYIYSISLLYLILNCWIFFNVRYITVFWKKYDSIPNTQWDDCTFKPKLGYLLVNECRYIQGGPLPVINGVVTPVNGLING